MPKSLSIAPILVVLTFLAACGGNGDSLGNAQPWCPLADDYIAATEDLSKAYRGDAKISKIEEATEEYREARNSLQDIYPDDSTSYIALEGLESDGSGLIEASRMNDDDEYYEEQKDDFEDAKELVGRICNS